MTLSATSRRLKRRKNPDPLGLSKELPLVSKRPHQSDDKCGNDILEAAAIFLALIAMTGAGLTLYHIATQAG